MSAADDLKQSALDEAFHWQFDVLFKALHESIAESSVSRRRIKSSSNAAVGRFEIGYAALLVAYDQAKGVINDA